MIESVELAKAYILKNASPEGLALQARSARKLQLPVKWVEHREAGGVVIDSAKIDFTGFTAEEIIKCARDIELGIKLKEKFSSMTLTEFLESFKTIA